MSCIVSAETLRNPAADEEFNLNCITAMILRR